MIKVSIKKSNNKISEITIKGHAGYDELGKDIVCASVSSIVITTINALERLNEKNITYTQSEGLISVSIINHDDTLDILIDNMLDLLKELEKDYKKNIKIIEEV